MESWVYILVVEDDADVARVMLLGLRDAGHKVESAGNGRDALALAMAKRFDVIILDRMLPGGVDGVTILQTLRDAGVDTSVLFLSGLGQLSDWVKGLQAGGDDYLVKPVSLAELLQRVELLYQQREQSRAATGL
jgi:two-component system OmpR family response regulator